MSLRRFENKSPDHALLISEKSTPKIHLEMSYHMYRNDFVCELLASKGMVFGGLSPDGKLVEAVELQGHPWFIGVQFHPEFKSRPFDCHPLFAGFIEAGIQRHTTSPGPTSRESSKNEEAQP